MPAIRNDTSTVRPKYADMTRMFNLIKELMKGRDVKRSS